MIAGILRGLILRISSEYLSNVDVNNLSLWSGHVTLRNVALNSLAITRSLNLPHLLIKSGQISRIDLRVPWTALSQKPVIIKLSKVIIQVALQPNQVHDQSQQVPTNQESLLQKIIANIQLDISQLTIRVKTFQNNVYVGQLKIGRFLISAGQQFVNPYSVLQGSNKYELLRKIEVEELSVRIISGTDSISDVIILHKFEKDLCGGCPLCYGFKQSQYYTVFYLSPTSFSLSWMSEQSESQIKSKASYISIRRSSSRQQFGLSIQDTLLCKFNLVDDIGIMKDINNVIQKSQPKQPDLDSAEQEEGWIGWGKSLLLYPFACSGLNGRGRIIDHISSSNTTADIQAPGFQLKIKIYNPSDFQITNFLLASNKFNSSFTVVYSASSENTFPASSASNIQGKCFGFSIVSVIKMNRTLIRSSNLLFSKIDKGIEFHCHDFSCEVDIEKKTSRNSWSTQSISGSVLCQQELFFKIDTTPLGMIFTLDQMIIVINTLLQAKGLLNRMYETIQTQSPDLMNILHSYQHQISSPYVNKTQILESTIETLKNHASETTEKLRQANQEIEGLRKALANIAGPGGLAGILRIEPKDIVCVSEDAFLQDLPVSLVLTADILYILTKEGRILSQVRVKEILRIEQRNSEISIVVQSKVIKCKLSNREVFSEGLKGLFN